MNVKICGKCKQSWPLTMYHKRKGGPDGLYSICKGCVSKAKKTLYLQKKAAKQKRAIIRTRFVACRDLSVAVSPVPVGQAHFEETVTFLTDAINNHRLNQRDFIWEKETDNSRGSRMAE